MCQDRSGQSRGIELCLFSICTLLPASFFSICTSAFRRGYEINRLSCVMSIGLAMAQESSSGPVSSV